MRAPVPHRSIGSAVIAAAGLVSLPVCAAPGNPPADVKLQGYLRPSMTTVKKGTKLPLTFYIRNRSERTILLNFPTTRRFNARMFPTDWGNSSSGNSSGLISGSDFTGDGHGSTTIPEWHSEPGKRYMDGKPHTVTLAPNAAITFTDNFPTPKDLRAGSYTIDATLASDHAMLQPGGKAIISFQAKCEVTVAGGKGLGVGGL